MGARMDRFVYRARDRWSRFACRWLGHPRWDPNGIDGVICVRCQRIGNAQHVLTAPSSLGCYLSGHDFKEHPDGYVAFGVHCQRCGYVSEGARRVVA